MVKRSALIPLSRKQNPNVPEFKTIYTKSAVKDLRAFPAERQLRILKSTKQLEKSPFPHGNTIKKLKGLRFPLYRLRVGDYRVVYSIDGPNVVILLITPRKELERRLKKL
jgi:mRNA interferase RelE/StbE